MIISSRLRTLTGLLVISTSLLRAETAPEFTTTESGLAYAITHHGAGPLPAPGQVVVAHYTGKLDDSTVFDSSRDRATPFAFTLGKHQVIKGWDEGFSLLHVGDRATLIIPAALGYGDRAVGDIPAGSTLHFDVEFVDLKEHALADHLAEVIDAEGVDAGLARFVELKAQDFGSYYVDESQLNSLGYRYLGKSQLPAALAVFKLNVELYPLSGNTHDSLGEALLANGEKAAALASYRQSLTLDPKNDNAAKVIAELTAEGN